MLGRVPDVVNGITGFNAAGGLRPSTSKTLGSRVRPSVGLTRGSTDARTLQGSGLVHAIRSWGHEQSSSWSMSGKQKQKAPRREKAKPSDANVA